MWKMLTGRERVEDRGDTGAVKYGDVKEACVCLGIGAVTEGGMWEERIAEKQFGTDYRGPRVSC